MPFAPEYVSSVLTQNFEDAKVLFLTPLLSIHRAHLVMLATQGIVALPDARRLRDALDALPVDAIRAAAYDGTFEDLFFYVERLLAKAVGEDVAGRLHTARSRNDIDMTMYRMRQRSWLIELVSAGDALRRTLLDLAVRNVDTVFVVHTHTQRAQPTTVAHYLLAAIEQLERDAARLHAAFDRTNRCPLGACAITGTGFPIDRQLTSDLLGFLGPTGNTYGSIATADYLLESVSATSVLLVGVGRFIQDLLLWSSAEFDYLRLGDGFVQCSSVMPQKRNPVALEHARSIASRAVGQAQAVVTSLHNTPFGDIVDTEDDLQPVVAAMFQDAGRVLRLLAAAMQSAEFDRARLEAGAAAGWATLTELADTLVRDHGLPFHASHAIAGRLVGARRRKPAAPLSELLAEASREVIGKPIVYSDAALEEILSPRRFVAVRRTLGGPAPERTIEAVAQAREQLARDERWAHESATALKTAEERLAAAFAAL